MPFDRNTTVDEVVATLDLTGRVYLVTGASSGLGKEAARALAARGGHVILAVRSADKGEAAAASIRARHPDARLEVRLVDLGSLASIRRFTDEVKAHHGVLHGLIANAGVMATDEGRTSDGFELQFGTNHLGHFLLVNRLVPLLRAGAPARVVVMSSGAHRLASVDLDDPNFEKRAYDRWDAYGQAKSANALFALAFDAHYAASGIRAFTVAPGIIAETNLHHHLTEEMFVPLRQRQPGVMTLPRKTLATGAATMVWALVSPELSGRGGDFLEDCGFAEVNPDPVLPYGVIPWVRDHDLAERVWTLSERLVGERFAAGASHPPSAAAVTSGLSFNRLPSSNVLAGTELKLTTVDGAAAVIAFDHAGGATFSDLPGMRLSPSGTATADVVEAAPGLFFIDLLLPGAAQETANIIADTNTGHALVVTSQLNPPVERATRLTQTFTAAVIGDAAPIGPAPAPTRDLIDHRALYHYGPDTTYEHIYINSKWYAYQCLKGARRGDCGCDHVSYYKIADDVYVVTWREILIDIAAVFVYDMKAMRTTGKAWGVIGGELRNVPAGAFIELLSGAGYPKDVELV